MGNDCTTGEWFDGRGSAVLSGLGIGPGQRVLDIGCGPGGYALVLARLVAPGGHVTAVDVDADHLSALARRAEEAGVSGLDAVRAEGAAFAVSLPENVFDTVLVFDVLQFVSDWRRLFRGLRRGLRAGGRVLVNPSLDTHPGRVNVREFLTCALVAGLGPERAEKQRVLHYRRMEEETLVILRPGPPVTEFRARVYAAACCVPRGTVVSYGTLAAAVDCASPRAVGQALKRNPYAPGVPCHRIVAADGSPGGFEGGRGREQLERKCALLRSEGVALDARGVVRDEHVRSRVPSTLDIRPTPS